MLTILNCPSGIPEYIPLNEFWIRRIPPMQHVTPVDSVPLGSFPAHIITTLWSSTYYTSGNPTDPYELTMREYFTAWYRVARHGMRMKEKDSRNALSAPPFPTFRILYEGV